MRSSSFRTPPDVLRDRYHRGPCTLPSFINFVCSNLHQLRLGCHPLTRGRVVSATAHGQKWGDFSGSIISTLHNLTCILICILILLLGKLLVLLTFIELLTNQGTGTGVQAMATAANITKSLQKGDTEFANSDFLWQITSLVNVLADTHFSFLTPHTVPSHSFYCTSRF